MRFIYQCLAINCCLFIFPLQVQTTTMCISVSLSGFVVLGCMFAPKVHIIMFQPQKNVTSHRLNLNRFSVSGAATTYASHGRLMRCFVQTGLLSNVQHNEQCWCCDLNQETDQIWTTVFVKVLFGCLFYFKVSNIWVNMYIQLGKKRHLKPCWCCKFAH